MAALAQSKRPSKTGGFAPPTDYKALVCVLLSGGNDGNNLIVPNHNDANVSNYAAYASARTSQGLAIPQNQLLPVTVPRLGGLNYGLHPSLGAVPTLGGINNGIHELWSQGRLAVVANTGNLIRPLTKSQYLSTPAWRPFQLFSHSDQLSQQQSSRADTPSPLGWAGRIADRTNATSNPLGTVPMITSVSGTKLFALGQSTTPLAIRDAGTPLNQTLVLYSASGTDPFSNARNTAIAELRAIDLESPLVNANGKIMSQAQSASNALSTFQEVTVPFPDTGLGRQLKQVARLIKKRNDVGVNRQIFVVEIGGFDTHQFQPANQATLLAQLSQALRSFYDEMGAQGIQNNVTTFTMSDFGRTLNPAGTGGAVGSDHGWGNNLLVLGGAVAGGNIYGSTRPDGTGNYLPTLTLGGPDDVDTGSGPRGRWLPTTSVEQYAGTLARWFGVAPTDLPLVFPNSVNFSSTDLGFMLA